MTAGREFYLMRRFARDRRSWLSVLALVAALSVPCFVHAAQQGSAEAADKEKSLYVPPGAAKDVEIGNYYFRKGNYRAALSRFEEAAHADPTYAAAYLGLGKVYEKIGLRQKALDAYQKYLDDLPSEKDAEEAKAVHRAMARLEKEIGTTGSAKPAAPLR
jgi:tetratricopeptide (TPR) repeat protein